MPKVEVPSNAADVGFSLDLEVLDPAGVEVTVTSLDPNVLAVPTGYVTRVIGAVSDFTAVLIQPVAQGSTTLRISAAGYNDIQLPVTVRAPEVEVTGYTIVLSQTQGMAGGEYVLSAPPGLVWSQVTPPAGAAYLTVDGIGTAHLRLGFQEGIPRPTQLILPYDFGGALTGEFRVTVNDEVHTTDHDVSFIYTVPVSG